MELTAMATPRPVTCWTSCCRSRKTPTLALGRPPRAPWAQGQALDQGRDRARAATAAAPQPVELLVAEQVSGRDLCNY